MDCEVLVVGLGPVGQLLALGLHDRGVHVVAVDQAPGPYGLPRAATTDDEALRVLQGLGLDRRVLADALVQRRVSFITSRGRAVEVLRTDAGRLGHPPLISLHQPALERTLLAALAERGVDVRWGVTLGALEQDAGGVTASVGSDEPLRAGWVVGCDGASSAVRARLGVAFGGSTWAQRWLVVDARVDRPLTRVPHPCFVGARERPTVTLPMSPGRHRWEFMLHAGEDPAAFLEAAAIDRRLAPWLDGARAEVERALIYTFHSRTAARWRVGRALLAGDAAHLMPPFAGQGLSSGVRDAANLAWKLEAVLRGAPPALLDSYEEERRPHVAAMQALAERWGAVVQTTRPRRRALWDVALTALDGSRAARWLQSHAKPLPTYRAGAFVRRPHRLPALRGVGSLFPQPEVGTPSGHVLLDDALGPGWALVTAGAGSTELPVLRLGTDLEDATGEVAAWLRRHRSTWVLLRPDRFVFACGTDAELPAALAARRTLLGE